METKIDKNNWCIFVPNLSEDEKKLFRSWLITHKDYETNYDWVGLIKGEVVSSSTPDVFVGYYSISFHTWYNEIYLNGQTAKSVENSPYTNVVTQADLQQLEERLTKLIEDSKDNRTYKMTTPQSAQIDCRKQDCKFNQGSGNCSNSAPAITINENKTLVCWSEEPKEQPKQDLPPFPFWVEITKCLADRFWYNNKIGEKFKIIQKYGDYDFVVDCEGKSLILIEDCKILHDYKPEEKKPIWETHPDWERCKKVRDRFKISKDTITVNVLGNCGRLLPFSEAHAKRQVAEIKLMEIAEKWNEGVGQQGHYKWIAKLDDDNKLYTDWVHSENTMRGYYPIGFNSKELADKSLELHKELWMDYFMISE